MSQASDSTRAQLRSRLGLRLWRKHAAVLSVLVSASLLLLGLTEMLFAYNESIRRVAQSQSLVAREVAGESGRHAVSEE